MAQLEPMFTDELAEWFQSLDVLHPQAPRFLGLSQDVQDLDGRPLSEAGRSEGVSTVSALNLPVRRCPLLELISGRDRPGPGTA